MKLIVYKGFSINFLLSLEEMPLVNNNVVEKIRVLEFDKRTKKQLDRALLSLEEDETAWVTYEEYTLIKNRVDDAIEDDELEVIIFVNNLYPEYYPIAFDISQDLVDEIEKKLNAGSLDEGSEACQRYFAIYNSLVNVSGSYYGSYYNYEYDKGKNINAQRFYASNIEVQDITATDFDIFINEDIDTYLRNLSRIKEIEPKIIGVKMTKGLVSQRIFSSLQAYCILKKIRLVWTYDQLSEENEVEQELVNIAKNDIKIKKFSEFRKIKFYKNPDIDKEIIEISQSKLIQEIIYQAEKSYDDLKGHAFRDIFITASTGAGKSVMFQIPAIYLARRYQKLTIIIEPVKALMQDQKDRLVKNGYTRVETFNSDLISQVEKEAVLKRIKEGEVDLLYLSPETLLSYSIETIIGDREIGLLIIDEAHIVTTWGMGFRPDYWYLGGYINRLRNQIQTTIGRERKTYKFPICAFTATAINGGIDDSVSDTVISLYMENPIKYIGYVRRDDIKFDIRICGNNKLPQSIYECEKTKQMTGRISEWLEKNEKTIVYFPYATYATDASHGVRGFADILCDERIGVYTGKNTNEYGLEVFNEKKIEAFNKFRSGEVLIMYATKAFGMGVDIDDVQNVYHYAASGNLCDYVQEIGRAARKQNMTGIACTDFLSNDLSFMNKLFGMSQIKQYQIKKVLEEIYDTYKNKKQSRSFLISPQSFTYIFNGKGVKDEEQCINKLKTCLLMLEKDFYDKYNFKVLISRPQSIFTKTYVVVNKEYEKKVLRSKYGKCFTFISKGRYKEIQPDGSLLSDTGDIYSLDLKQIWEEFHPNISFPQFKYFYFNVHASKKNELEIMPSIRELFSPRQKINIETKGEYILNELRDIVLEDFEYIGDALYREFGKSYFTLDDFARTIAEKYGMTQSRIIVNSLFDLVDPNRTCVKQRSSDGSPKVNYTLANGNFKEYMRKSIIKSKIVNQISRINESSYSSYMSLENDEWSHIALKVLSIFGYITYEVLGGEEPEIFIRLNDPNKIKNIVLGNDFYSNNYVNRARQKHDRDVKVLRRFFDGLRYDQERWDYIEEYFLGYDVLCNKELELVKEVSMVQAIDKEKSYPTHQYKTWGEIGVFFDDNDHVIIDKIASLGIGIPEYISTTIKKSDYGDNIMMSWVSKDTVICQQETLDEVLDEFRKKGWNAYRIYDIDYEKIKGVLR